MANFSWSIPQTTLTASGYSVNLNVDRELYLTIANLGPTYGGGDVTISASWQDSSGAGQTATVIAGGNYGPTLISIRTLQISGVGASIVGELSSSKVSADSLLASTVLISSKSSVDVVVEDSTTSSKYPVTFNPSSGSTTIPASGIYRFGLTSTVNGPINLSLSYQPAGSTDKYIILIGLYKYTPVAGVGNALLGEIPVIAGDSLYPGNDTQVLWGLITPS